ncbi:MAG: ComF family protein [Lawsonibacter sp.]|jgi:competence protein ComFC
MKTPQLPRWAGRAGTWLLDLLFPMKCPFCQHILEDPRAPVCPDCQKTLPWLTGRQAERPVEFTSGCLSPLAYRGRVPDSIHRYKFPGTPSYAGAYGLLAAQCVRDNRTAPLDLVTWVPLSPKRKRKRGFDQAEALARAAAQELDLPVCGTLEKVRNNDPQSRLHEASERRANVLGVYCLREGVELAGRHILLVDDVVTSGATLSECARLLRSAGAAEVLCTTLAQARRS